MPSTFSSQSQLVAGTAFSGLRAEIAFGVVRHPKLVAGRAGGFLAVGKRYPWCFSLAPKLHSRSVKWRPQRGWHVQRMISGRIM